MKNAILVLMLLTAPVAAEEQVTKVVQAKHRPADSLIRLLPGAAQFGNPLLTSFSRDFNTITLSGPAEKVKIAEAIIEQYDTPRRQAEFVLRLVEASSTAQGPNDAADLIPAELKSLLRYTRFAQRDSAILRGMEADELRMTLAGNLNGKIQFRVHDAQPAPLLECNLTIRGPVSGTIKGREEQEIPVQPELLETSTSIKNGETVVLGASKMQGGNNGLIVLLTAKLLK